MFDIIKKSVNLLEQIADDTELAIVECGTNTFKFEEDKEVGCPFCGHKDCFKMFFNEEEPERAGYHCFSCEAHGSVIDWVSTRKEITLKEAATELAKEHGIQLPSDYNPLAEIFNLAATYYENCMWETCKDRQYVELARMSPLTYQKEVRKHSEETLKHWHVGWSDGGLIAYLESLGFDEEILNLSGLRHQKTGRDFLPSRVFIYPHYVKGRVSHFTFKDPLKKLAFQLPNKYSMNGHEFWGQDTVRGNEPIIVVEGENDLLSTWAAKPGPVLATIGQLSGSQMDWMRETLANRDIITIFDPDEAGDKYRVKIEKIRKAFKSLRQIKPEGDDIDKLLSDGADLDDIIAKYEVVPERKSATKPGVTPKISSEVAFNTNLEDRVAAVESAEGGESQGSEVSVSSEDDEDDGAVNIVNNSVIQKKGSYWKIQFNKDGEPNHVKISNFSIVLKNIYISEDGDRNREVVIVREDGYTSKPLLIDSEAKVSLKNFRVLIAKAADADFSGTEKDLGLMWGLVYSQSAETQVSVTRRVGRHDELGGWIFRNKFITDSGATIDPDKEGVFWLSGKTVGVRPDSLRVSAVGVNNTDTKTDIPFIEPNITREEADELMSGVIQNLSRNLNKNGQAMGQTLTMLGWIYSCVFSNTIYNMQGSFPMLFLWGTKGEGKTTILKWMLDFFGMRDSGFTTITQLKSAVGWDRKVAYYASLPMCVDEIRSDNETQEYISKFRAYWDRVGRSMGVKDEFGVREQAIRSCVFFGGEDQFEDPAARERCIPVRIPVANRETVETYRWIEDHRHLFTGISYYWILDSIKADIGELKAAIRELDKLLVANGCSRRTSKNWAVMGVFAMALAERYVPDFDFKAYLIKACTEEATKQREDTTVAQFFELVEALQASEHPRINNNHVLTEGNLLHIWYPAVYKAVVDDNRQRFPFSKNAVLSAIKEEPYFHSDSMKVKMGLNGIRRIVLTLDLTKAPDTIKNIAQTND
ncbi:DNA primase [compost metagenome]